MKNVPDNPSPGGSPIPDNILETLGKRTSGETLIPEDDYVLLVETIAADYGKLSKKGVSAMKCFRLIFLLSYIPFLVAMTSHPNDEPGSKDHPMFSRMPNYIILEYASNFDAVAFPVAADKAEDIEGIKTRIVYYFDENSGAAKPSMLQIIRNYTGAAKKLGGKIVYEGESEHYYRGATCTLTVKGKDVWVMISPSVEGDEYVLTILEKQDMVQNVAAVGTPAVSKTTTHPNDEPGSKDHPMFSRMPNFFILEYSSNFDAAVMPVAPDKADDIEGMKTRIKYLFDEDSGTAHPSLLQIIRNYTNAIKKLGGNVVYEGESGHYYRGATCSLTISGKQVWVTIAPSLDGDEYVLTVLEKEAMVQDVTANEILTALNRDGRVALYIHFDTAKASIKPESQSVIDEVATLLKDNSGIQLTVEGHTDNVGEAGANKLLSEKRAESVVKALTGLGIDGARLNAAGFGEGRPIADNNTEEGRAKNRRVELVKK